MRDIWHITINAFPLLTLSGRLAAMSRPTDLRRLHGPPARALIIGLGVVMMVQALRDLARRRARFESSEPPPGSTIEAPPAAVIVRFDRTLEGRSVIVVERTGAEAQAEIRARGSAQVTVSAGVNPEDPERASLRAELQGGLPDGVYRVRWSTVALDGGGERTGQYYFGVRSEAPQDVFGFGGGPVHELDVGVGTGLEGTGHERATLLVGGVLLLLLGWLLFPRSRGDRVSS